MASAEPTVIRVTEIGEFIRHKSCERRLKLEMNGRHLGKALPFYERLFNPLDPVLQEAGRKREDQWESSLVEGGLQGLTPHQEEPPGQKWTDWEAFAKAASRLGAGEYGYGREVRVRGPLGAFQVEGRVDFILLLWKDGEPILRLAECKASRRDRTYHRIQVATYRTLLQGMLEQQPLVVAGKKVNPSAIECVVARIDEATSSSQDILALPPLTLEMEAADIDRLFAPDGAIAHVASSDLADLDYQLDQKCDGCVFNVHCLTESGRQRCLELLSISPAVGRSLRAAGVGTIDDLARLDLTSEAARRVREDPGFSEHLGQLKVKAGSRRRTLPEVDGDDPDSFEVESLPNAGQSQLPPHEINGSRLVRIYLSVDYDYSENRVGAICAHVTSSEWEIYTGFTETAEGWRPTPEIVERRKLDTGAEGQAKEGRYEARAVEGEDIVEFIPSEWTGRYEADTGAEKQLIQAFLSKLVDAIAKVAGTETVPIHFYVWSRSEMARLVEACSRVNSKLLGHLRELLGCRESLEQLLYSCLQDEADQRYALGWTGRGLAVVSSLRWFGRRYHWTRRVSGKEVRLDVEFTQDLFDFKTELGLTSAGGWAREDDPTAQKHKFEVRSRFHDSLPAPYWRAYWQTLPSPEQEGLDAKVASAIKRYNRAAVPGTLASYLRARIHALRWIEEGMRFKNSDISKPLVKVSELPNFSLGVEDAAQASIDFLRLDQHVKVTDWITAHLVPPGNRVPTGSSLPVRQVIGHQGNRITATISLEGFDLSMDALRQRCTFTEGSFVRLAPRPEDHNRGQTLKQLISAGFTGVISQINWETGQVELEIMYNPGSRYILRGLPANRDETIYDLATIDESPSDFVAGKVEDRLRGTQGAYVARWLDPERPSVPGLPTPDPVVIADIEAMLSSMALPGPRPRSLSGDQVRAVVEGLQTRIQLLQGPPGTGKTMTTAVSTLCRVLLRRSPGDIVLVAAQTHTAVDNLLQRIDTILDAFSAHASQHGLALPAIGLMKVHSSEIKERLGGRITDFPSSPSKTTIKTERRGKVLVIGGTTTAILKLAKELSGSREFPDAAGGFQVPALIVDEASMMVFPHFLALATLVAESGEVMLAGDHRQLAPILAHDWEREDRPPAVLYQPFASAYQAVMNVIENARTPAESARRSALTYTFRLPPLIRELISRIYRLDDIDLDGLPRDASPTEAPAESWESVWQGETGLYLVLHPERRSRQSNPLEAKIVKAILEAGSPLPDASVAVMTPHRAQRSLLKDELQAVSRAADVIDTVERMQGGERPTVIVSATASDPSAISANVEFILDLNRSNVAFSRAQDRLIVVCSDTLLDHIPPEVEHYESAMLWKSLRSLCSKLVGTVEVDGHVIRIMTPEITEATSKP